MFTNFRKIAEGDQDLFFICSGNFFIFSHQLFQGGIFIICKHAWCKRWYRYLAKNYRRVLGCTIKNNNKIAVTVFLFSFTQLI
jgi:hypothetical protein